MLIIDGNNLVIPNPDRSCLGLYLKGWVSIEANGYNFAFEMFSATEEGKWLSYVLRSPELGSISPGFLNQVDLKNAWVARQDGLLFDSSWCIDADQFTMEIVTAVVGLFNSARWKPWLKP